MSINKAVILLYFNPDNNDQVLSVSRKDDHTLHGLPGGKVEPDETYLGSLVREIKEELETDLPAHKCSFAYQDICGDYDTLTYVIDDKLDLPTIPFINDEGAMVSYQPISKLIGENYSLFSEYNLKLFKEINDNPEYIRFQK